MSGEPKAHIQLVGAVHCVLHFKDRARLGSGVGMEAVSIGLRSEKKKKQKTASVNLRHIKCDSCQCVPEPPHPRRHFP